MQSDILNTEVTTIDGDNTTLESYKGKVLLIVNVASKCGLTPQYEQLENIQKASKGRAPLYPDDILWNFEKFLIGRDGQVVQRFSPDMTPEDPIVMESIKLALAK